MTHELYDDIPNANATPEMHYRYAHRYDNLNADMPKNTGIKIIKNNFIQNDLNKKVETKSKRIHIFCEHCNSELEISKEDTYIGWLGAAFVKCPCCGQETMVDELDGITLTKGNIDYPIHFNRTNKDLRNVVEVKKDEVIKEVQRGIDYFRVNKNESYWYTCHGDLFLIVFRYEGDKEYFVLVTRDFYETDIPFEKEDYND